MKNSFLYVCVGLFLCLTTQGQTQENEKLAQTGLQFLSVVSDARAAALAGAMTSTEMQSSSLFFNPAGMANMSNFISASFSKNTWIADINHNTFSFAINPSRGTWGVFGVSVQTVDYGDILGTIVAENDQGYEDTGIFSPSAFAAGVGYAKALSDRFSFGAQVKWVKQNLGECTIPVTDSTTTVSENEITPLAYDLGTQFKTGFKSLTFGMSVRNFSKEIKFSDEGFQLPLVFTLGISMNLMDLYNIGGPEQAIILSVDATHYRSHPEQLCIGLDYKLVDMLAIRGGYLYNNDEEGITFGVGISQFGFDFDYAYTPFGVFNNVQRVTARFSL